MTPEQAIFELDLYGFTVLPEVLKADEIMRMAAFLDAADERIGIEYSYEDAFARLVPCVPALDDMFLSLIDHEAVLPVLEGVLGDDIILGSMNARIVRPGDPHQGLHSDIPSVHRRILGEPVMLQVVWMIDGFTDSNGATRIVPGSHRLKAAAPREDQQLPYVLAPTAPAGSVLIFNGQCWHGGGANESSGRRRAVFGHYRIGPWMRFQTDPVPHISQARWEAMSFRQREIMRMIFGPDQKNAADYYPDQAAGRRYQ